MKKNKILKQYKSDSLWSMQEKVLLFSQSEEFRKKFTHVANERFASLVYSIKNFDLFFIELHFTKYHVIYLDIDSIFHKLDEILTDIRNSKNKRTKIYLVTSNIENSYALKKREFPKNIFLLLNGKEIIYLSGDRKYIY